MADDFLGALRDVYGGLSGMPTLWTEMQPELSDRTLPNAVLEDMGETPTYDPAGERYVTSKARITFYGSSKEQVKALAETLKGATGVESLTITGKVPILFRGPVRIPSSPRRGPKGEFMYMAMIDYTAYIGGVS